MQNTETKDKQQNLEMIPLSKWNEFYPYPKVGTLRQLLFYNTNGFEKVICRIGKSRIYIKVAEFWEWAKKGNCGVN